MIAPAILLLGSYLAVGPGIDMFLYPKLLAILIGAFLCQKGTPHESPLRPYFPLILGLAALSAAAGASPLQSALGLYRSSTAGLIGLAAAWMAYEAGHHRSSDDWGLLVFGAASCSILALLHLYPGAPWHGLIPNGRVIGTVGSPPYLGCMLALAVPVAAARAPRALLFILPALLATRSKAAILGAIAGACVLMVLRSERGRKLWVLAGACGTLAVVLALNRGASDTIRIQIWKTAWDAFLARPLFGWGPDNFLDAFIQLRPQAWIAVAEHGGTGAAEAAHNLFLHILATRGLLGMAATVAFAVAAGRALLNQAPESIWNHEERNTLLACTAAVVVYSLFNPTPFMAWAVLSFMLGSLGL